MLCPWSITSHHDNCDRFPHCLCHFDKICAPCVSVCVAGCCCCCCSSCFLRDCLITWGSSVLRYLQPVLQWLGQLCGARGSRGQAPCCGWGSPTLAEEVLLRGQSISGCNKVSQRCTRQPLRLISYRQGLNSSVHVNITSSTCSCSHSCASNQRLPRNQPEVDKESRRWNEHSKCSQTKKKNWCVKRQKKCIQEILSSL